jgi:hypothetical protein
MNENSGRSRLIVNIPTTIAREILPMVGNEARYPTLDDFFVTAMVNQLAIERETGDIGATQVAELGIEAASWIDSAVTAVEDPWESRATDPPVLLLEPVTVTGRLSPFTNRLSPLIVPLRLLARFQAHSGSTVDWNEICAVAPLEARAWGLKVRAEDERAGRRGRLRRWTGWPVGSDEMASLSRYRSHFLGRIDRAPIECPLVALGFVGIDEAGNVGLTREGWQMASCLEHVGVGREVNSTLSAEQQHLLSRGLARLPEEWSLVRSALKCLYENEGDVNAIDQFLIATEASISQSMAASTRSALVGRLIDAGLAQFDLGSGRVFPIHGYQ